MSCHVMLCYGYGYGYGYGYVYVYAYGYGITPTLRNPTYADYEDGTDVLQGDEGSMYAAESKYNPPPYTCFLCGSNEEIVFAAVFISVQFFQKHRPVMHLDASGDSRVVCTRSAGPTRNCSASTGPVHKDCAPSPRIEPLPATNAKYTFALAGPDEQQGEGLALGVRSSLGEGSLVFKLGDLVHITLYGSIGKMDKKSYNMEGAAQKGVADHTLFLDRKSALTFRRDNNLKLMIGKGPATGERLDPAQLTEFRMCRAVGRPRAFCGAKLELVVRLGFANDRSCKR
eukprot:g28603.t1